MYIYIYIYICIYIYTHTQRVIARGDKLHRKPKERALAYLNIVSLLLLLLRLRRLARNIINIQSFLSAEMSCRGVKRNGDGIPQHRITTAPTSNP